MTQENVNKDELKFVTRGMVDRNFYKEFVDVILRKSILIKIVGAMYILFLACSIWAVCHQVTEYVVICVVAVILFSTTILIKRNSSINVSVQQVRELCGTDSAEMMSGFADDFIYIENFFTGKNNTHLYHDIKSIYKTKHYIFLVTKGRIILPIFKTCLTEEELKELFAFLKSKIKR
jgi:hypothetical protein